MMDMMFEAYLTQEAANAVGGPGALLECEDIPAGAKGPAWVLGKRYELPTDVDLLRTDVTSRLWMTYRKGFVSIGDSGLTSDKGWGCMLRCGQMVLAQALVNLHLGRDWRWSVKSREPEYLKIVSMFQDRRASPYSIHQIALTGASEGKAVGQWFGPNTVAQVLKKLTPYDDWSRIRVHVALDNTIVIDEVRSQCVDPLGRWQPLLLVVPLRLGLTELNPVYLPSVLACFKIPQTMGLMGGKPNHALYLIGCVGEEVLCLDPHTTQPAGNLFEKEHEYEMEFDKTFHCNYATRLPLAHLDPSLAACFLCSSEDSFNSLCQRLRQDLIRPDTQPMFELCETRPPTWSPQVEEGAMALSAMALDDLEAESAGARQFDDSDEDFELLG